MENSRIERKGSINMKPLVGLIPLYDEKKESYWMLPGYMKMLQEQGAIPVMLPLTSDESILAPLAHKCSGFLLTGGQDVSPELYGEQRLDTCGALCKERDEMEKYILQQAILQDKPVLGICRGIQFLNVYLGGTLYQDLPTEYSSHIQHHMEPPYDREAHTVTILENTRLSQIIGAGRIGVNSYHHQAVKTLGKGLVCEVVSEDGLIEAVAMEGKKFIVGVQWHPEFFFKKDANSVKIAEAFVSSMASAMAPSAAGR